MRSKLFLSLFALLLAVVAAPAFAGGGLFPGGQPCNQTTCGAGQFCCNYSCSVCAPVGGACTDVYCPPVELSLADTLAAIDVPAADAAAPGEPAVVAPETAEQPLDLPIASQDTVPEPQPLFDFSTPCNEAVCGPGEYCCNYSCSTCVARGDYCTTQICPPTQ